MIKQASQRPWRTGMASRLAAGAIASLMTTLIVLSIHLLASTQAAGPLGNVAAESQA